MDVLLLGKGGPDRKAAGFVLTQSGHRVHECHDGTQVWGCAALSGVCPLEQPVDVALATADFIRDGFDPQGVVCSRQHHVPVVAVGAFSDDAILEYADGAIDLVSESLPDELERIVERYRRRS